MTGSKAAIAAMVIAVATTVVVRQTTSRARLQVGGGMLGVIGLLVAIVLAVPVARTALLGSADVRVDYWRAGVALVAERPLLGHGLEGFSVQFPRVKLPGGEETVLAHQETLQAAVDLGLPAAVVLVGWWIALLATMRPTTGGLIPRAAATGIPPTALIVMSLILLFACSAAGVLSANLGAYPGLPPFAWAVVLNVMVLGVAWHVARGPLPSAHACWCAILACLLHVQADFSLHSMQVVGVLAWVACLGRVVAAPVPAEPAASATNELGSPRRQGLFAAAGLLVLGVVTVGIIASAERGEVLERARASEAILARLRLADAGRLDERQRLAVFDAFESAVSHVVVEDGRAALTSDPREALAMAMIRRAVEASRRFPADHDLVFAAIALGEHLQALLPARASVLTPVWENLLAEWPQSLLVIKSLSEHYLRVGRAAAGDEQRRYARQAQALAMRAVELYPTHLPLRQTLIRAAELTGDQATVDAQRAEITRLTPLVHRDNRVRESAR
jgi:O-antigen ligase